MSFPTIYGFNGSNDVGEIAFGVSIFLKGCNLLCPYCMNSRLVLQKDLIPFDVEIIKNFVYKNKREWITISGGEPTLHDNLPNLIDEIKSWGCKVSVSTNGTKSLNLTEIIGKLDYVAIDVKTSRPELAYPNHLFLEVMESLLVIGREKKKRSEFNFEVRTTLYPPFVNKEDIVSIANIINKDSKWVLQQFRLAKNRLDKNEIKPYSDEQVDELLQISRKYVPRTLLGYV